ncbi:hypothetical protein EC957_002257 [Mortierella hygrophila]|uniref:Uncharacterized protein n=1 Tax=Mortierella hygrophila TaxID=979708 RepID=A0A9P6F4S5_9FUNG|nr:hypothetical protein EC957_002257 [Mortierella hygrophila]
MYIIKPTLFSSDVPSNLNCPQFVESVNRAMDASQAPRSSCFGSYGLISEELRRINGPIPSIHADVHDATERQENITWISIQRGMFPIIVLRLHLILFFQYLQRRT